uniref:Uncharacterized protein n=1 Tax=Tetraselmis sp. GSL018 TaxID=582737 RepID=A0A061RLK8_9CHLO
MSELSGAALAESGRGADPASRSVSQIWELNLLVAFVALSVALLGVGLPWFLYRGTNRSNYSLGLSMGNMLSAGGKCFQGLAETIPCARLN